MALGQGARALEGAAQHAVHQLLTKTFGGKMWKKLLSNFSERLWDHPRPCKLEIVDFVGMMILRRRLILTLSQMNF